MHVNVLKKRRAVHAFSAVFWDRCSVAKKTHVFASVAVCCLLCYSCKKQKTDNNHLSFWRHFEIKKMKEVDTVRGRAKRDICTIGDTAHLLRVLREEKVFECLPTKSIMKHKRCWWWTNFYHQLFSCFRNPLITNGNKTPAGSAMTLQSVSMYVLKKTCLFNGLKYKWLSLDILRTDHWSMVPGKRNMPTRRQRFIQHSVYISY